MFRTIPPSRKLVLAVLIAACPCATQAVEDPTVAALTEQINAAPDSPFLYHRRGVAHFFNANSKASVADFDKYLASAPSRAPYHWQRGISLYYADRFADATKQFQDHDAVNPRDVENATWLFLCQTRAESLEAARKALIPYRGDSRVPMREIHQLFAGTCSEKDVITAAKAGSPTPETLKNQLCYAYLYLALYQEALGNHQAAMTHIKKAAVDHKMDHYMGMVAQVHYRLRQTAAKK
ncbi:MAG: hypothetical protein P8J87_04770 [Verrucomicrobiales bacterium]|nr:hypothetical protein [Verrucomicrobiales bacterium]